MFTESAKFCWRRILDNFRPLANNIAEGIVPGRISPKTKKECKGCGKIQKQGQGTNSVHVG